MYPSNQKKLSERQRKRKLSHPNWIGKMMTLVMQDTYRYKWKTFSFPSFPISSLHLKVREPHNFVRVMPKHVKNFKEQT